MSILLGMLTAKGTVKSSLPSGMALTSSFACRICSSSLLSRILLAKVHVDFSCKIYGVSSFDSYALAISSWTLSINSLSVSILGSF